MKWSKLLILFVMAGLGVACSDDNPKEQDPELDMDLVINQDLYYNPWLNNPAHATFHFSHPHTPHPTYSPSHPPSTSPTTFPASLRNQHSTTCGPR